MTRHDDDVGYEKELRTLGHAIYALDRLAMYGDDDGYVLTSVRFKLDADEGTSVLAVLTARLEGVDHVAFVGGGTLRGVVLAVRKKVRAGRLRWRESVPYGE